MLLVLQIFNWIVRSNALDDYYVDLSLERLDDYFSPSIFIPILVRNKGHALPYFLGGIENLNYPKNRIKIWFVTDHNDDDSLEILSEWKQAWESIYNEIELDVRGPEKGNYDDSDSVLSWSQKRYDHILKLKQEALEKARKMWCDYILYIDADIILLQKDLLLKLISRNKLIIGPMLETGVAYSNFWTDQNLETGYYERGDNYFDIRNHQNISVHEVPMLNSCYLVDMNRWKSERIQFYPRIQLYSETLSEWPHDDIIYISGMLRLMKITTFLDNTMSVGWFPYPVQSGPLQAEVDMFTYTLMEMNTLPPVGWNVLPPVSYSVPAAFPEPTKFKEYGVNEIYMINLERRKERFNRMDYCFRLMGIAYKPVSAVDGKLLTKERIDELGIKQLPGFSDPFQRRQMTKGEVGCFLSHFNIWQEAQHMEMIIVLEDDVRFKPGFVSEIKKVLQEAKDANLDWDLIYIGRKRGPGALNDIEKSVTKRLVSATYSYWTIGYILTGRGAKLLVDEEPLTKMLPVDEYLPIMYGAHKDEKYASQFKNKNLKAYAVEPVLLNPTHYTGENNYFTDTEPSDPDEILFKDEL